VSYARKICQWSDKLPPECRDAADAILVAAAAAGADLPDLVQMAAEMYARSRPDPGEDGDRPDEVFEDRKVGWRPRSPAPGNKLLAPPN